MIEDIKKVQEYLNKENIDAYIVFSNDPHCSEYMVDKFRTIRFFSSFTGSNGILVITKDKSYLWTDGRYFIQATKELKETNTILMKDGEDGVLNVEEFLKSYKRIALDYSLTSIEDYERIKSENNTIEIINENNLVDSIWKNRPSMPTSKAFLISDKDAGESIKSKLNKIQSTIKKANTYAILISSLDDIAWIFNLRGYDIPFNTTNYAFALITKDNAIIYIDDQKLDNDIINTLNSNNVCIKPYLCIYDDIKLINETIVYDSYFTNLLLYTSIKKPINSHPSITSILKSIKNNTEIENIKKAHIIDAVAMIKFIKYVKENHKTTCLDELALIDKLLSFRQESPYFITTSFETICGFNSNGAIVHYSADKFTNLPISENGLLLVDSGGQYKYGTTDITRTIVIGNISEKIKHDFTLVLKAHIALAKAIFKVGTTGKELDEIARRELLIEGKDYKHGTGHGVGYFANVHEGPQSISKRAIPFPFVNNLLTSNEPGYYVENEYGIRHENLTITTQIDKNNLSFETITLVPFDLDGIDKNMLTKEEIDWINIYHKRIYDTLSPILDKELNKYLKEITKEICSD